MAKGSPRRSFERGWVEEWQGNRGILKTKGTDSWFFVRAYNMEPEGSDFPVKESEEVAFQWIHEGKRMVVTRCVRLRHVSLPTEWAAEEWPPSVGEWIPTACIGKGGNGEVWRAGNKQGREVAIKYLHRTNIEGQKRFRAEIKIMQRLKGVEGILPILECNLPAKLSLETPAWFVMPLAVPLDNSPAAISLESLVDAFAQIATTLAELAERGISHRDIKPDNLLWFNGRPVVGDFGLVDFPGKETATVSDKKLGPLFYLAPEMLNEPHLADGRTADVYSLAKSLWVMATGQTYPIPGEHREAIYQTRLSTYVYHRKARHLDGLISRCTKHDPAPRPAMSTVAQELRSWFEQKETLKPVRPRRCTERELAKVGVQLTDSQRIILHCRQCRQGWSPNLLSGGRLPRGYWMCPNHCNWE